MSLNTLEGFELEDIVSSVCFHLFSCSHLLTSLISLLCVCIWLRYLVWGVVI